MALVALEALVTLLKITNRERADIRPRMPMMNQAVPSTDLTMIPKSPKPTPAGFSSAPNESSRDSAPSVASSSIRAAGRATLETRASSMPPAKAEAPVVPPGASPPSAIGLSMAGRAPGWEPTALPLT